MIDKPKQYYDTRRHQLYYQWSESEYFYHQEPIYDRTKEYIESLEAENAKLRQQLADVAESMGRVGERCAKLREYAKLMHGHIKECCDACGERGICDVDALARSLGIEVPE